MGVTIDRREFIFANLLAGVTTLLMDRGAVFSQTLGDPEIRIDDLVKQLTLDEKVQFLRGDGDFSSMGNKRLGLPGVSMADSPQGIRIEGNSTVFPSPVAMAALWNTDLIEQVGAVLGRELKAKGRDVLLGPCVNIHRSPLGGRNVESFGEDPYLSGSMATAYIKGVQSEKVAACVKHFAANNLETRRLFLDVSADLRYLHEIEFPPFKMAVQCGGALAIMASYNQVNGHYSWANHYLLNDVLRGQWHYKGLITSDWGCEWMLPEDRSVLESVDAGTNIHMPQGYYYGNSLAKFVREGKVNEKRIDELVTQILIVVRKLGLNAEKKKIDPSRADTKAHHDLSRQVASESIVLLKNNAELVPLDARKIKSIAVIGPNADIAQLGDRGSAYAPTSYTVSPLQGLRNKLGPAVKITFEKGYHIGNFSTIPVEVLSTAGGKRGLLFETFIDKDYKGIPVFKSLDEQLRFDSAQEQLPKEIEADAYAARWTGKISVDKTRTVFLGVKSIGNCKLFVGDRLFVENAGSFAAAVDPNLVRSARIDLRADKPLDIRIEYFKEKGKAGAVELLWSEIPANPFEKAVSAAKDAEVVIFFGGLNTDHEGEGLDRFNMDLPDLQNELIAAISKVNPKTIVVLNGGTPSDLTHWIDQVPAVFQSWYPGMEGGNAVADVIFGEVNASGKLPVTFGKRREDYADFPHSTIVDDKITYGESNFVGYRHFDQNKIAPLFPFGHGLSYTTFGFSNLEIKTNGNTANVSMDVKNTGKRTGKEVVQLYLGDAASSLPRPPKELKAFRKVELVPGQTEHVTFELNRDAFSFFDSQQKKWIFEPGEFEISIGSSSRDIRLERSFTMS